MDNRSPPFRSPWRSLQLVVRAEAVQMCWIVRRQAGSVEPQLLIEDGDMDSADQRVNWHLARR